MKLFFAFCLWLLTLPVYAGHYVVTYSGGSADGNPYVLTDATYGSLSNRNALQCEGTITATFTWQSDTTNDAPPQSVIVRQMSDASWTLGVASSDDGLGDLEHVTDHSGESQGTHDQIKNDPGPSFTVQCTPHVTVSSSDKSGTTRVRYQAQAFPIVIDLTGTLRDTNGSENILVGQNCTATVTVPDLTNGVTLSSVVWTIPGKSFTRFQISGDQSVGKAISFVPKDSTTSTWYWIDGEPIASVRTIQVSAQIQNGDVSGTVTAQKSISVWSPKLTLASNGGTNPVTGTVAIQPDDQDGPGAIISNAPPQQSGFDLVASVATPEFFASSNAVSLGQWAWLQLCRLNVTLGGTGTRMKQYHLDSAFPYNMSATTEDIPGTPWAARSTAKKPAYQLFSDSPEEGWAGSDTALAFDNAYRLYAMYQPPSNANGDGNWVPVQSFQWGFHGHIARPNAVSKNWTPNPPGAITYSESQINPDYPSWTAKFGSGGSN